MRAHYCSSINDCTRWGATSAATRRDTQRAWAHADAARCAAAGGAGPSHYLMVGGRCRQNDCVACTDSHRDTPAPDHCSVRDVRAREHRCGSLQPGRRLLPSELPRSTHPAPCNSRIKRRAAHGSSTALGPSLTSTSLCLMHSTVRGAHRVAANSPCSRRPCPYQPPPARRPSYMGRGDRGHATGLIPAIVS